MRLWHYKLIPLLPRQQLLGQHRECCALRGLGWGKKHKTVDYVFRHSRERLFVYHWFVMAEMRMRGYTVNPTWLSPNYYGQRLELFENSIVRHEILLGIFRNFRSGKPVYPEHNDAYLDECLENLKRKGVFL